MSGDNSEKADCFGQSAACINPGVPDGMSPYATGGGGVTFERKVAVQYLAHLLTGDGAVELGDGRRVVSVSFQQAPDFEVDDLVIAAARSDESNPSLLLALAVRRKPNLVRSHEPTLKLIRDFVHAVINTPPDGPERRLGLVVAGPQPHARQLSELSGIAAAQMDALGFFDLVNTPKRFSAGIRTRLDHVESLVQRALQDLGAEGPDTALVRQRTWQLLSRLTVLMPRLEDPDETDWAVVANSLTSVARDSDLAGALQLRDRLVVLASEYSPKSAQVGLTLLRRDAHSALDIAKRRNQLGWRVLDHLHDRAIGSVRDEITASDGVRHVHLDRSSTARELVATAGDSAAVVVSGESGVGKSALALLSLTAVCGEDPDTSQALCINLRQVPKLSVELETKLGCPLSTLLCELSASHRMLIIDGADAIVEGMEDPFRYLVDAAIGGDLKIVAVTAVDSKQAVHDILNSRFDADVSEFVVPLLTDAEIQDIVLTLTELNNLYNNPRSRALLRRLVVIDLLVRGRLNGVPLSDADAMGEVWSGLVRRRGLSDRGDPFARELVLLRLAGLSLSGGDRLDVLDRLDPAAIAGLRRDGLLQEPVDNPFMIGPDFAHDEVRRYAVARFLLSEGNVASKLLDYGVPRWALGAAQLACQELLQEPDQASKPLHGRFGTLQSSFDALAVGHSARWGDVPSDALLTLADPSEVLRDAWAELRGDEDTGLRRLARLVDQRLRGTSGIVDPVAIEPIISLLLEEDNPRSGKHRSGLLREWLCGLVVAKTSLGHPLRIRLREYLVEACAEADRRFEEQRMAEADARAVRSKEDIKRERQLESSRPELFTSQLTFRRRPLRKRPEVPRECTDEAFLELLALLGPDLGEEGEAILLRVARDAPASLAPAVEAPFAAVALAQFRCGLLAELTEAYYLDDEAVGSPFDVYGGGVRRHDARIRGGLGPQAAWYFGPFMVLFQTDPRSGITVLNRLLNHAALVRARKQALPGGTYQGSEDIDISAYQVDLEVTGTRRTYIGDGQVWCWYRGTGVGPYPCMSALQALERICDQFISQGIPIANLAELLLESCENLAMVGLITGMLVRHMEIADNLLDPYFAEPVIWHLEVERVVKERGVLAASSEGNQSPDRRAWSLREAAMAMAINADDERAVKLRRVGETLVKNVRSILEEERDVDPPEEVANESEDIHPELAKFMVWASCLDRDNFQLRETPEGLYLHPTPPEQAVQRMENDNRDFERTSEEIRLSARYLYKIGETHLDDVEPDELASDITSARELLEKPALLGIHHPWDIPAAIAATALEEHLLRGVDLPDDALVFATETLLRVSEGRVSRQLYDFEDSYFEQGADRSAGRAVPLLLMPSAVHLRTLVDGADGSATFKRAIAGGLNLAREVVNEVRLHLARSLDHLWATPCVEEGQCHHESAWEIAKASMQDCALGGWHPDGWGRSIVVLDEPVAQSLAVTPDDSIKPSRLDAAIRALAPAAMADICISELARDLLTVVLNAQSRALLQYERDDLDERGTHSLVTARAILTLAQHGDDTTIFEQIHAYANHPARLGNLLRALSAAAEETPDRASVARLIWPNVIRCVLDLNNAGHITFQREFYGDMALAALFPNSASEVGYLYREPQGDPIKWWDPLALQSEVEAWLGLATGRAICVDQLISHLRVLTPEDQAQFGLPWVAKLVLTSPGNIANRCYLLADWLIETRSAADAVGLSAKWQEVVDALVVEGVTQLALYSE